MNKIGYLDCPTGLAGDMCLGALVDAGVPLEYLQEELKSLQIEDEYQLHSEKVTHQGQVGTKVHVDLMHSHDHHHHHHDHPHGSRHLPEIVKMIEEAKLAPRVEERSLAIFQRLALAEAAVHGIEPERVHFHEVGATDALVDIVGTCLGLEWLGIDRLFCSALPTGGGTVKAAHGILPVPAPAVLKLWEMAQVPVYSNGIKRELVTPTGAAISTTLATSFGSVPSMQLEKVGLGAGSAQLPLPNLVRLWVGSPGEQEGLEQIAVLETQIDDLSPQAIGYCCDRLFAAGALDVFTQPIMMKKSRLGVLLTVICPPAQITTCETIVFQETTTLGIRRTLQERSILRRELRTLETPYGSVQIKLAWRGDQLSNLQPEYEDCAQLARQHNLPWRQIHQTALELALQQFDLSTINIHSGKSVTHG
ncbi:nickel pincer cofactor biosynthesis protein LarC [Roseofilum reptotaenium CS-1145]|uniref:Putative nickel insertion protein n=1 Tax=Roseofilum reptotaenium AO1-A TaxID=1925591 RepID=A0A1L9QUW8_9CYAN|nr:nickel pincer cofactor biosynthesis protein LarC [Roseofilum reptotaenium]MDB9516319.1 nickel pincer cofactor biosynthesis protein LarC [Roseofilum reptotaenium CS-1145]OJJ26468.1 TIGR00299 family protein [Roseofilum reptotaenium AO1-A]